MNERLAMIRALMKEKTENREFSCSSCGSKSYHRVVVYELTADSVGRAAEMILKCAGCTTRDGGFANVMMKGE